MLLLVLSVQTLLSFCILPVSGNLCVDHAQGCSGSRPQQRQSDARSHVETSACMTVGIACMSEHEYRMT